MVVQIQTQKIWTFIYLFIYLFIYFLFLYGQNSFLSKIVFKQYNLKEFTESILEISIKIRRTLSALSWKKTILKWLRVFRKIKGMRIPDLLINFPKFETRINQPSFFRFCSLDYGEYVQCTYQYLL